MSVLKQKVLIVTVYTASKILQKQILLRVFKIKQDIFTVPINNYVINYNGRHADLHNNFDFGCYTYDVLHSS